MAQKLKKLFPFILILYVLLAGCAGNPSTSSGSTDVPQAKDTVASQASAETPEQTGQNTQSTLGNTLSASDTAAQEPPEDEAASVSVHFIDVGQGDSIFIQSEDASMLIDAGTNESGSVVTGYLESLGVTHLDWVIGTHPHEDHIGGLDDVIGQFEVDRVMMPPKEHTTKTFEDVLDAVEQKNLALTLPEAGDSYTLGSCSFTILGPVADYDNELNNWSIVLRLDCKDISFLFTGDAESEAEADIVARQLPLKATVLKVGHHGSDTSTSDAFLEAVAPNLAVISAGSGNDYGHPCQSTLDKLSAANASICRTDLQGNIVVSSDGTSLDISTQKEATTESLSIGGDQTDMDSAGNSSSMSDGNQTDSAPSGDAAIEVHITKTGEKYHRAGCSSLSKSDIPVTLEEAKARGYTPCKRCNPPQ